jgi:hypothetical protein
MDQNALLTTARTEFMRGFVESMQRTIPRCIEDCFLKADDTYSSLEQGRLLDARSILVDQSAKIVEHMTQTMEQLLARSFKTTYSTYRPSANFNTDSLTLIDPTTFEGGLRLEEITNRFRREAEEQLRDLNIRIALIFEQEVTNERENPFRPYLFSKCIASTIEGMNLDPNVIDILIERLADNFVSFVPTIYSAVNTYLARNGVAAQLQLKIRKSPTQSAAQAQHGQSDESFAEEAEAQATHEAQQGAHGAQPTSVRSRPSQIEQFFSSAMSRAASLVGRGRANNTAVEQDQGNMGEAVQYAHGQDAGGYSHDAPQEHNRTFSWVKKGEAVGDALKKFFGTQSAGGEQGFEGAGSGAQTDSMEQSYGHGFAGSAGNGGSESGMGQATGGNYHGGAGGSQAGAGGSGGYSEHTQGGGAGGSYGTGSGGGAVGGGASGGASAGGGSSGAYGSGGGESGASGASQGGSLPQSIHRFQRTYTPSGPDMFDGTGGLRNLILEQRSALNELTSNVDEQMTIDIVAMLFEFILRDTQVPAEIRAQLGRLQFLVLKVALRDNTLLTQKGHPARLLVNRIGSISLGLKQIDPSGAEITKEICRIVETLLQDESENPQLFSRMLDEFDAFIAKELRASDKKTEHAIDGAERARNRTLRFAHISAQLHEALIGLTIDPFLQNFFETVWVYALELADCEDPKRAHRYRLLVPDLLWSIVPKYHEEERMQLLALLPIILNTIKEGVRGINWDVAQQEKLLNWLVDAHTKAMRTSNSGTMQKYPSLSAIHQHFESFFTDPDLENYAPLEDGDSASDVKKFLADAIKELDVQVQLLDQVYVQEQPKESEQAVEPSEDRTVDLVMEQLKTGVTVEINLGGEPSQGKLNWIDPALTNLVLTLDGQEQPSMVSVRMFRRMIAHGRVKFLEAEPLFERAVQSLLKSADTVEPVKP